MSNKTSCSHRLAPPDILIFSFGALLILVVLGISLFLPNPTEFQALVLRVMLALAAAAIAAGIPGFINVQIGPRIRAGGALAVFFLVYAFNPPALLHNAVGIH